jgi:restriction endonuclease S subunit
MKESIKKRIEAVRRGEVPEGYVSKSHQLRPVDWKYEKIGKYLVPYDEFSNDTKAYPLATSSRQGLMLQSEYYIDQRYEETTGGFHVVPVDYVTYRHMSDDDIFRFNLNKIGQPVLVSPEYPVFTTTGGLNQDLLVAYLNGMKEFQAFCSAQKKGSTRTRMYFHRLCEFTIPIPSITEQQKIAGILATCDRMIELKQSKIAELNKLKQVCLLEMFPQKGQTIPKRRFPGFSAPWEQRKLGELADIVGGGTPSTDVSDFWDGDIDWYAPAEIAEQIYLTSSQRKITEEGYNHSSAKMLPIGTVLFTSRAGIGKTAILTRKGCTNQGFQSIVPHKGELDSYFIFSRTEELKQYGETVGAGSTFVEVSGKQMANMELMMPKTMAEQKIIGQYFANLDRLIILHQRELAEVGKYKKALMQLLLTGLVRVNA